MKGSTINTFDTANSNTMLYDVADINTNINYET